MSRYPRLAMLCRLVGFVALVGLLVVLLAHCAGCQSYTYAAPDGTRITINRLMTDAEIGKLTATAPNGTRIELEGLKSESEKVAEAVARGIMQGMK